MSRKIVIGVGGASGQPYAQRTLRFLAEEAAALDIEPHVVFSTTARLVWKDEIGGRPEDEFDLPFYSAKDMTAPFASGSAQFESMLIIPCSAGQLGRIAHGISTDLISRAADVMLKERRRLVMVLRETPFSLVHIRNMEQVTLAGGLVMPASPSFYSKPRDMTELVDTVVARALDRLDIDNSLMRRWSGLERQP